jgi:hypothetical protein
MFLDGVDREAVSPMEDEVKCEVMYAIVIFAFFGGAKEIGRRDSGDLSTAS